MCNDCRREERNTKFGWRAWRPHLYIDDVENIIGNSLKNTKNKFKVVTKVGHELKLHHGMAKVRYLGIKRNRIRFQLMCVAHNIKRGRSIQRASCA